MVPWSQALTPSKSLINTSCNTGNTGSTGNTMVPQGRSTSTSGSNTTTTTNHGMNPFLISSLNGPESAPVVCGKPTNYSHKNSGNGNGNGSSYQDVDDEEGERCRYCHATGYMHTDWAQGDRVCTNCGVVAESRLRDDGPEWKDFKEAEDLVKGLPSGARSGLVAVDESKYLGGLQPTTLSKHAFGGGIGMNGDGYGMARMRKRLKSTNKRLDHLMGKLHTKALTNAKLDRSIRIKQKKRSRQEQIDNDDSVSHHDRDHDRDQEDDHGHEDGGNYDPTVRPELEQVLLQEEEDAHRLQTALYAEKWSLDRSLLLYGQSHEQVARESPGEEEREELEESLDRTLRKASHDMYVCYGMLRGAAQTLELPDRVQMEATHRMVRFVTRKDGFRIPGIASRLSSSKPNSNSNSNSPPPPKEVVQQLKEYNLRKQMAGLGAGLLFLTARSLGWTRSIAEICACFDGPVQQSIDGDSKPSPSLSPSLSPLSPVLIKTKHVSRAMKEIQSIFPEYGRLSALSSSTPATTAALAATTGIIDDTMATAHFADHFIRKLQLPPVAEASIRTLLVKVRDDQVQTGRYSGTKLSTLCATLAYLVCTAGSVMQRLAQQQQQQQQQQETAYTTSSISVRGSRKRRRLHINDTSKTPASSIVNSSIAIKNDNAVVKKESNNPTDDDDNGVLGSSMKTQNPKTEEVDDEDNQEDEEPFDVFSHAPIVEDPSEKQEYELRRMWDAWAEQMSWSRSLAQVEQSCGVSRTVIQDFYKSQLYPRREELLQTLSHANLQETPLAPILLAHVSTAAPLMSAR